VRRTVSSYLVLLSISIISLGFAAQDQPSSEIRLCRGDAIRLFVYDGPLSVEKNRFLAQFHDQMFIIDGFGNISIFSLGELKIVGLTADKVADLLHEKFLPYATDEPVVVVKPLIRVNLRGEFIKVGMFRFDPSISFWEMVEQAGGFTGLAMLESVYILRKDDIIYRDFAEALHQGQSLAELGIESGDEIVAPRLHRLTFQSIIRYAAFGMSLVTFYFTLMNYQARHN
jgi:protein involved in polysaccharide export with SLBB domain